MEVDRKQHLRNTLEQSAKLVRTKKTAGIDEAQTKAWLIEPVLQVLGWNTGDPTRVHPEWKRSARTGKKADYALLGADSAPAAIVEAKRLNVSLDDIQHAEQAVQYAQNAGVPWAILTNGHEWRLYEMHTPLTSVEKRWVWTVHVDRVAALDKLHLLRYESLTGGHLAAWFATEHESNRALRHEVDLVVQTLTSALSNQDAVLLDRLSTLTKLNKDRVQEIWSRLKCVVTGPTEAELEQWANSDKQKDTPTSQTSSIVEEVQKPQSTAPADQAIHWLPLTEPPPVHRKPLCISVNGEVKETNAWSALVVAVAEQAAKKVPARFAEALKSGEFAMRNKKRLLSPKSDAMNRAVKVGSGYVETNLSAAAAVEAAGKIARFMFGPDVVAKYAIRPEVDAP